MFISPRYQVIFVHLQRTGGYSIHDIFRQYDPDLIESISIDPSKQRIRHCYARDIHAVIDPDTFKQYRKFCVVRHPYMRMKSWYHVLNAGYGKHEPKMRIETPIQHFYQKSIHFLNKHPNIINGYLASTLTLFFRFLDSISHKNSNFKAMSQGENTGNQVLVEVNRYAKTLNDFLQLPRDKANGLFERFYATQFDYISDEKGKLLIDDILHLENLDHEFNTFAESINFPGRLQHLNKSKKGRSIQLDSNNEKMNRSIVKERFAQDYDFFGYEL
jgi:hypothetical protein